jgi:hypothetical protein
MKIIVVSVGDNDDRNDIIYLDASTPEKMDRACLSILKARRKDYEYYYGTPTEPAKPSLSFEEVEKLPAGAIKDFALSEWSQYHKLRQQYESEREDIELMDKALSTNNGKLAYKILKGNSREQRFEIKDVQEEYPN